MKTVINLCIIFIMSITQLLAQEQHTFSSKEDIFSNWIKRDGEAAFSWGNDYHRVGELLQTYWYEIRNFDCWQWTYNEIPTEATVTSVTIKFRVNKGNYQDSFTFSLHNIPYILNTPSVDFFNESNSNQVYLSPTLTPDGNHNVFFNQTFTAQTPVGQGWEIWNAVNNAVQSGSYFLTLGIRERASLVLPYWIISGYELSVPSTQPCIELTIVYELPDYNVTVDQKLSNNTSVGTVGLWNSSLSDFDDFSMPHTFNWEVISNTTKTLQGAQSILSNQKYLHWENNTQIDNNVVNHKTFTISPNTQNLTSRFNPTQSGVTIKNEFPENPGLNPSTDNVEFKDPWFIDYPDPEFPKPGGGYYEKNRGMNQNEPDALLFYSRTSPFYPDYNTNYGGRTYKGVFLNQPYSGNNPVYYSVKASSYLDINLGGQIGTRRFYFKSWEGTDVDYENADALETGVVFTSPSATANADLKGQGLSNNQNAFSTGSQRKFVKTADGTLHYVYSSLGHVYYEISTDGGVTWVIANGGNYLDSGEGKLPAIDESGDNVYPDNTVLIVYQERNGNNYIIKLKKFGSGVQTSEAQVYSVSQSYDTDANPVVTYANNTSSNDKFIVMFQTSQGLRYSFGYIYNGQITWSEPRSEGIISGTDQNSVNPTLTARKNIGGQGDFYLAWQQNNTQIYYKIIHWIGDQITNDPSPTLYSSNSGFTYNYLPSISIVGGPPYYPVISWVGHNGSAIEKIAEKPVDIDGTAQETKIVVKRGTTGNFFIAGNNVNNVNNNSTIEISENSVIVWSEGTTAASKWVKRTGTTFSTTASLSNSGIQAQVSNGSGLTNLKAMVFNTESTPYYFKQATTNFCTGCGIEKITAIETEDDLTFGRTGIVGKGDVQFVFNVGDIILADTSVLFIPKPDTLLYMNTNELNQDTRSLTFHLNNQSQLYFTDYYYTVNPEIADSVLNDSDSVSFRVELVNANTNAIVCTFDDITYTKSNLEEHKNINYQVDCSAINEGDYYLKLVTIVSGDASYNLANVQNDEPGLEKREYNRININGNEPPAVYELSQNYPNPFNPSTTIKYQIPQSGNVIVKVFDILGAEVATLVNVYQNNGRYEINFDASKLSSGVYLYQLRVNDFVQTKKMVLLR